MSHVETPGLFKASRYNYAAIVMAERIKALIEGKPNEIVPEGIVRGLCEMFGTALLTEDEEAIKNGPLSPAATLSFLTGMWKHVQAAITPRLEPKVLYAKMKFWQKLTETINERTKVDPDERRDFMELHLFYHRLWQAGEEEATARILSRDDDD